MKVAALDLGSNTFLCLIAEVDFEGRITVLEDLVEVVRLGQGLANSGRLSPEALQRASECLNKFSLAIQNHKPDRVLATATAAARKAANGAELIALGASLGIPIEIIPGEVEAQITFKGALSKASPTNNHLVIDIGGGSTELIAGTLTGIQFKKSFEIGVVKLREKFIQQFPVTSDVRSTLEREIKNYFSEVPLHDLQGLQSVIAVAGTPTTLAAAALGRFEVEKVEGYNFSLDELKRWAEILLNLTPEEIEEKFAVPKGRSDVLAVGVLILIGALEAIEQSGLTVSTRGLRYGLALQMASEKAPHA